MNSTSIFSSIGGLLHYEIYNGLMLMILGYCMHSTWGLFMSQTTYWKGCPVTFGGLPSYPDSKEIQRIKILWTIKSPHKVHEIYMP